MTFDISRFTFKPENNFLGVIKQQGRVDPDGDWNEWLSESSRRAQAANLDTLGLAVVPAQTADAFKLTASGSNLLIGPGRMYLNGLIAENHGLSSQLGGAMVWDPVLAEQTGTSPVPFDQQPYLPGAVVPGPGMSTTNYFAYLDVWGRAVNNLQRPDIVEKAIGSETTGRIQNVWQTKLLQVDPSVTVTTPLNTVQPWVQLTQSSAGRLSTNSYVPDVSKYTIDSDWTDNAAISGVTFGEIAIDQTKGVLYVVAATTPPTIEMFDLNSGDHLGTFEMFIGSTPLVLGSIGALFFDAHGFLYLGERFSSFIGIYKVDTTTGQVVKQLNDSGAGVPNGIYVDGHQNIYTTVDGTNHVYLYQFSNNGTYAGGLVSLPSYPAVGTGSGLYKSGNTLYLASAGSVNQLIAYQQGSSINTYVSGEVLLSNNVVNPAQVTVDSRGNVYLASEGDAVLFSVSPTGVISSRDITVSGTFTGVGVDAGGNVYIGGTEGYLTKFENPFLSAYTGPLNQFYRTEIHQGYSASNFNFLIEWGSVGTGQGQFTNPSGVGIDNFGSVYVSDAANDNVQLFDSNGNFQLYWGGAGTGSGQFEQPQNVCVDASGKVYVVESAGNRVQVFNAAGGSSILTFGTPGSGNGNFNSPTGITVDVAGNIYVADTNNDRIQVFNLSGGYQTQWGTAGSGNGQFSSPTAVAIDSTGTYIYVVDSGNNRIQKFTLAGGYQNQWGTSGSGQGQFSTPKGIAVDAQGNVYVTDTGNKRVQVFNPAETYQTQFGGASVFGSPQAIGVDRQGNVYVADYSASKILKFSAWNYTFKWSRDNGSVATQVLSITADVSTINLSVESMGEGEAIPFTAGDWVELMDDNHELNNLPGELHQIAVNGVDPSRMTIVLQGVLIDTSFLAVSAQTGHLRLRRWDQQGKVYLSDGVTVWYDLNNPTIATAGVIPVPADQSALLLEDGVTVTFSLDPTVSGGHFDAGDYWDFAARTVDQSIEHLLNTPPRGIHHHYTRIALVSIAPSGVITVTDTRDVRNTKDCCTICVTAEMHNNNIFTIAEAIKWVDQHGGGSVCLGRGTFTIGNTPVTLSTTNPLILKGEGSETILVATTTAITVNGDVKVLVKDLQTVSGQVPTSSGYSSINVSTAQNVVISSVSVNSQSGAINVNSGTNIILENINVINAGNFIAAINVNDSANITITDILYQTTAYNALAVTGASDVSAKGLRVIDGNGPLGVIDITGSTNLNIEDVVIEAGVVTALSVQNSNVVNFSNCSAANVPIGFNFYQSQDISVRGFYVDSSTLATGGILTQCSKVILTSFDLGISQLGFQIESGCADIMIEGLRAQCSNGGLNISGSKGIRLSGMDIDGGTHFAQVDSCAGVTIEKSTARTNTELITNPTAFVITNCTGVVLNQLDIETTFEAINVRQSNDVKIRQVEMVCGNTCIALGLNCFNVLIDSCSMVVDTALDSSGGAVAAISFGGIMAAFEISNNVFQSPWGITSSSSSYLTTIGLVIEGNQFICSNNAILLQGNCFHTGLTRIANNTFATSVSGAIVLNGAAFLGTAVEINSNQIDLVGTAAAITVGTECRIVGNQISGSLSGGVTVSPGIVLGGGLDTVIQNCAITDNRLINVPGEAIKIQTQVNNANIARNFIDSTMGGIVFRDEGSAVAMVVEKNSLTGIISPTTGEPSSAIGLFSTTSGRVVGNQINGVLCNASAANWGGGILATACNNIHVSDNEIVGTTGDINLMAQMGILGPFDRINIESNEARYNNSPISNTPTVLTGLTFWALAVETPVIGTPILLAANTWVLNINGSILLAANGNGLFTINWPTGRVESVRVLTNRLESISEPGAVSIQTVGECQFTRNYCALPIPTGMLTSTVVQLNSSLAMFKSNRVRGGTTSANIANATNTTNGVILGNMTTQSIQFNGAGVPSAWTALNVIG